MPEDSFLREPHIGIHSLESIPASVLDACPIAERANVINDGESVSDLVVTSRASLGSCSTSHIDIQHEGFNYRFNELMRADFDDDRLEELMLSINVNALGGTLGYTKLCVFRRDSHEEIMSFREYDPFGTT